MKALYAYFGLLNLHEVDSPGHSLYQIGLMDSIRKKFEISKFDFFSYYPVEIQADNMPIRSRLYPETDLGNIFEKYKDSMICEYCISFENVLDKIVNREYESLFLKARFRNLSTLTKKWKDAFQFERIIETAITSNYSKDQIIILDTDLSLPSSFFEKYGDRVKIVVPSIDMPGISREFLIDCVNINICNYNKKSDIVFYGNIDTSSYKSGNSKSEKLEPIIKHCEELHKLTVISKEKDFIKLADKTQKILRKNREEIWKTLEKNLVMLNVTKDKYNNVKFIPARIYEAMIFGMIPVSYTFSFLSKTFSFNDLDELEEILKYLGECSQEDLKHAYFHFITQYLDYVDSQFFS